MSFETYDRISVSTQTASALISFTLCSINGYTMKCKHTGVNGRVELVNLEQRNEMR